MFNEIKFAMLNYNFLIAATYSALGAFCLGGIIALTKRWHAKLTSDTFGGVQNVHTETTPRVGGVAIYLGLALGGGQLMQSASGEIIFALQLACLPALMIGLAEDLTKRIPVPLRLMATMTCGVVGWWLTGYSLSGLDIPVIDDIMQNAFVSVLFTSFAIAGVANSINIIDGFNGLAGLTSIFGLLGLGLIAGFVGDLELSTAAVTIAASVVGFLFINWPLGKLFMGDGGAYFLGFSIAWIAVMLVERNSSVSPFSALLICSHPVNEVLFSIYRRWQAKAHPGLPDHKHLHSLAGSYIERRSLSSSSKLLKNSLTGGVISLFTLVAVLMSMITFDSTVLSQIAYLVMSVVYIVTYYWLKKDAKKNGD
jgi:UDP-N-acetylmuramyl pentapeptide phosphotransferase/UDP-N-acetylglucosamine-1-phosphate transferase